MPNAGITDSVFAGSAASSRWPDRLGTTPEGRVGHAPGPDAAYRRVVSGDIALWIVSDAVAFAASGNRGWTCPAIDAQNGAHGDLPEAQDQSATTRYKIYPYLLRGFAIKRPDQVWYADITYVRMWRGFLYLVGPSGFSVGR